MVPQQVFVSAGFDAKDAPKPEPGNFSPVPSQEREAGPSIWDNRLPPDLPDEVQAVVPEFKSRRKAETLPNLRPAPRSNELDPSWCRALARADWHRGFRWGVVATVGGLCLALIVIVVLAK